MQNQFFVFCICIAVGFVSGIAYELLHFLRLLFGCKQGKNIWVETVADIAFFAALAIVHTLAAYLFHFPAFRVYMWIGEGVGLIIYLKTLHKILAFLQIMCYNRITKLIKRREKHDKTLLKREKKTL